MAVSYVLSYLVFFGIILGMTYYYADRFGEYFNWLLENDYINETQCSLLNQSTNLGMIIIIPNIIMISFTAFILLIFIQNKILTLFLPKKQKLEKVISFVSAMDKLEILTTKDAIDFILKNKIKVYVVDEPFDKKNSIRENCYAKFVYYAMDRTYLNRGKLEQYIGKNVLCFEYNDFISYNDILKNYKKEILQKALEENTNKFNQKFIKFVMIITKNLSD